MIGNDFIDFGGCFRFGFGWLNFIIFEIILDVIKMKVGIIYNIIFVLGKRGWKLVYVY